MTRVVLLNTFDKFGGAAIACKRLFEALKRKGLATSYYVQYKTSADSSIKTPLHPVIDKLIHYLFLVIEQAVFALFRRSKSDRFKFSMGLTGRDLRTITHESDIVHLHWINQGFLSLKQLSKLFSMKKPIVWTLHDTWAFTGGCHYNEECPNYLIACGNCFLLKNPHPNDLSHRVWKKKKTIFSSHKRLMIVTCSNWLKKEAEESSLFRNMTIVQIPNPIDTEKFTPGNPPEARKALGLRDDKKYILAGAANLSSYYKGFSFFVEAMTLLKEQHPETLSNWEVLLFGKGAEDELSNFPYKYHFYSYLKNEEDIIRLYQASSVFALPSLRENLPNMIMEALACGTPTVAFRTGGIPEMVDHKENGYLAKFTSAKDLANGIFYVLEEADQAKLSEAARQKALNHYDKDVVASRYDELYNKLLAEDV